MAETIYMLCAVTSVACAYCLFRSYFKTKSSLLLWSSVCFGFLALNNVLLFVDLVILPDLDFGGPLWRSASSAIAGAVLLMGLIWEVA